MKIAIYTDYVPFEFKGGAERRIYRLITELVDRGHDVHVFAGSRKNESGEVKDGVTYHTLKNYWEGLPVGIRNFVYVLQTYLRFLFLDIEGFDVIDAYRPLRDADISTFAGLGMLSFGTLSLGKKLIVASLTPLQFIFCKSTRRTIATSKAIKEKIVKLYGEKEVYVVYSGINEEFLSAKKQKTDDFTVCSTKNPKTVLEVARKSPNIEFKIMGETVETDLENVEVLGKVSHGRVLEVMSTSNLFLHPTRGDSASMSTREAMGVGLPVVANKVGGLKDFIEDGRNGIFVRANDVDEVAQSIKKIKSDKKLRDKLSKNARKTIRQNFDWDFFVRKTERIYEMVKND